MNTIPTGLQSTAEFQSGPNFSDRRDALSELQLRDPISVPDACAAYMAASPGQQPWSTSSNQGFSILFDEAIPRVGPHQYDPSLLAMVGSEISCLSETIKVDADRNSCMKLVQELPDAALPETMETLIDLRDHYRSLENPSIRRPTPPLKHNVKPRVLSIE